MAAKKVQKAQVWAVRFGDRSVQIRELPVGKLAEVARATNHSLIEVVGGPFSGDGSQLEPIVRAVAEWVGPEAQVPDPLSFQDALGLFELVDDDLPEPAETPTDADPPTGSAT